LTPTLSATDTEMAKGLLAVACSIFGASIIFGGDVSTDAISGVDTIQKIPHYRYIGRKVRSIKPLKH